LSLDLNDIYEQTALHEHQHGSFILGSLCIISVDI